ncbi:MAG: hydroxymethylglutaryl-CoA reductase, degradative, partial [Rhodococcus sp. (in: high G+C Gram-positive bacteria)]
MNNRSKNNRSVNSRIADFRSYDVAARRAEIVRQTDLTEADIAVYDAADGLTIDQADRMVENVLGVIGIPVGVATNFTINGKDYLIPLATEEPSVVAAASNAARIARGLGGFHASSTQPIMQAQIQLVDVVDPEAARIRLLEAREEIMALANEQDPKLVSVGGGVKDISVRVVSSDQATYVVLHLHVDVRDAMGANAVNTMAEAIADRVSEIGGGHVVLRILTNKADLRLTRVRAVFDAELIGGAEVVDNLIHAARLAELDPYRAATHNKGIMNGISAVVLATGNDTRAVEAGCHSHAVNADGIYSSLSHFEK